MLPEKRRLSWARRIGRTFRCSSRQSSSLPKAARFTARLIGAQGMPADTPVLQPTLVIKSNARPRGIEVPETLLATADEVIE
jgi:hypothetical protein